SHGTRGCRNRLQVHQPLAHRLSRELQRAIARDQLREGVAAAHTGVALLTASILLHEHRNVETHERPNIRGELSLARCDEHHVVHGCNARSDMYYTRIDATRFAIDALEPGDLVLGGDRGNRVRRQIELMSGAWVPGLHATITALHGDRPCGARGFLQSREHDLIGIRETCLLARQSPDSNTLLDAGAAILDDAVLQRPGLLVRELEVEVREVDRVRHHFAKNAIETAV